MNIHKPEIVELLALVENKKTSRGFGQFLLMFFIFLLTNIISPLFYGLSFLNLSANKLNLQTCFLLLLADFFHA